GFGEELTNLRQQVLVGAHLRTMLLRLARLLLTRARRVIAGSRPVPNLDNSRHNIPPVAGRRGGAARGIDFPNGQGGPFSKRAIFSRSSSLSTLTAATTDFKRRFSSSSTSVSRLFRLASPPARKRLRQ